MGQTFRQCRILCTCELIYIANGMLKLLTMIVMPFNLFLNAF